MNSQSRIVLSSIVLLGTISILGCGKSDMGRVTGTIHLDGKLLPNAMVTFYPELDSSAGFNKGRASHGRTDVNGRYELIYTRTKKGAEIGTHMVEISTLEEGGGYGPGSKELLPEKYNVATTLKVTVKPGNNTIDFLDLDSEGRKQVAREESY